MKKLIALAIAGGLSLTGAVFASASANNCGPDDTNISDGTFSLQTEAGGICGQGNPEAQNGHLWADGNEDNPDPFDGYITASNDETSECDGGVGANGAGDPGNDADPEDTDGTTDDPETVCVQP